MNDYQARWEILQVELDEAKERIRMLENVIGIKEEVPQCFRLTAAEVRILGVLLKRQLATKEAVMLGMYSGRQNDIPQEKIIDVMVCKMRRKLKPFGIEIQTMWGRGWSISPEDKFTIQTLLDEEAGQTDQKEQS